MRGFLISVFLQTPQQKMKQHSITTSIDAADHQTLLAFAQLDGTDYRKLASIAIAHYCALLRDDEPKATVK